jgi:hypothetical protein
MPASKTELQPEQQRLTERWLFPVLAPIVEQLKQLLAVREPEQRRWR